MKNENLKSSEVEEIIKNFHEEISEISNNYTTSETEDLSKKLKQTVGSIELCVNESNASNSDRESEAFLNISLKFIHSLNCELEIARTLNYLKSTDADFLLSRCNNLFAKLSDLRDKQWVQS